MSVAVDNEKYISFLIKEFKDLGDSNVNGSYGRVNTWESRNQQGFGSLFARLLYQLRLLEALMLASIAGLESPRLRYRLSMSGADVMKPSMLLSTQLAYIIHRIAASPETAKFDSNEKTSVFEHHCFSYWVFNHHVIVKACISPGRLA